MSSNSLAFELGVMYGYAMGLSVEHRQRQQDKPIRLYPEDVLIMDYVRRKTQVNAEDVIGYLNWNDTKANRIGVGVAMQRIGWERRRGRSGDRQWYYVRGAKALAHGEPTPQG